MPDYKKLYFKLFRAIADAAELMEAHNYEAAWWLLVAVQQEAEEMYLSEE